MKQKDELEAAEDGGYQLFDDAESKRKKAKVVSFRERKELRSNRGSLTVSLPPFADYDSFEINVARPLSPWDVHEETMRHVIAWVRFHRLSETSHRTTSPRRVCRLRFPTLRSQLMHAPARGRRRRAAAVQLEDDPAEHADSEVPPEEARSADSEQFSLRLQCQTIDVNSLCKHEVRWGDKHVHDNSSLIRYESTMN